MRIGVMSDSHGELDHLLEAGRFLVEELGVDLIVHLGDDEDDADVLRDLGPEVITVPGVFSARYKDPAVENRVRTEFGPWRVLLSHTPERHKYDLPDDPDPQALVRAGEIDLLLHGHTHTPFVTEKGSAVIVNPGHLKSSDTKGHHASFACLEVQGRQLEVTVYALSTKSVLHNEVFTRA
ncbi:MAG: YfcE family phosphodiesterase [Verrucomicrobia bacterium]|nr:YfcE family phosphodiesterase [Verrucomicrobiota bacterium]